MEQRWNWEQGILISELIRGMELAKQLRMHLDTASSVESRDLLVQKILSSYEKALLILNLSGPMGQTQQNVGETSGVPESPLSINGSPRSDDLDNKDNQDIRDVSKKRRMLPRWTDQVRVGSENLLEGPHDDGYSWRKYGQKDILGAKYPRSYYRCTYRKTQNCWATKQVQRSDEDPTIFEVTYRGTHTCAHGNQAVPPPASPEKQEHKPNNLNNNNNQQWQSQDILLNIRKGIRVNTEGLDNKEMAPSFSFPSTSFGCLKSESHGFLPSGVVDNNNISGSFSSPFMSPATPKVNFSVSHSQMNNSGGILNTQHSESDLMELISVKTSATNSSIMDFDFSLDQVELDPNFPFNTPEFFP
ncbi:probable WRKY transcription factor 41 [Durio zibethinus]|uniref:Probable WRKY transcription factor 41 n=1 Tax=Durio zibethinus TaxID=66656 RepID=A0A6P5YBQ2_DURZI|nr:probable WRKY transcription factor 41 [Durio zibethinus]